MHLKCVPYSVPFPFLPVFNGEDSKSSCVLLGLGEFLTSQTLICLGISSCFSLQLPSVDPGGTGN